MKIGFAVICLASKICVAQPFVWAAGEGDSIEPAGFVFIVGAQQCVVRNDGVGYCPDAKRRAWTFRLPVDGGRIDGVAVASLRDDLVLAYQLTDEEASWGRVVRIKIGQRRPKWHRHISGLNLALPVMAQDSVFVAALAYIARIRVLDGGLAWRREHEYVGGGYEASTIAISGKRVIVERRDITTGKRRDECFVAATGESRQCDNGD